jgi:hypothetical protein
MQTHRSIDGILFVLFIAFFTILALVFTTPIKQEPELLFDKDGCKTYVFYSKGTRHYYTDCEK